MIYGYLRVSTDTQDINSQRQGVEKFAAERGWKIEQFITDEGVSGGKDPSKRNLGPMLEKLQSGDIVIAAEISRLGRDLYMVMDILHFCMERGVVIHTVKDRFTLGDDIQSKVLAFAFGLSAEIERQMIRQRTREGLRMRMKLGVLCGRPLGRQSEPKCGEETKARIIEQYKWGVPKRRIAENFKVDRNTIDRWLMRWGIEDNPHVKKGEEAKRRRETAYRNSLYKGEDESEYARVELPRDTVLSLILQDLTIPQIHERLSQYTYEPYSATKSSTSCTASTGSSNAARRNTERNGSRQRNN